MEALENSEDQLSYVSALTFLVYATRNYMLNDGGQLRGLTLSCEQLQKSRFVHKYLVMVRYAPGYLHIVL